MLCEHISVTASNFHPPPLFSPQVCEQSDAEQYWRTLSFSMYS